MTTLIPLVSDQKSSRTEMSKEMLVSASQTGCAYDAPGPPDGAPTRSSMPVKKLATFWCSTMTPLGRPVEPEVKMTYARFSDTTPDDGFGISSPSEENSGASATSSSAAWGGRR